jgi:hypothetical protein
MPIIPDVSTRLQRGILVARIALAAGTATYAARTLVHLPTPVANVLDNWVYDNLILLAAVLCAAGGLFTSQSRAGWVALGIGIAAWAAGDTY